MLTEVLARSLRIVDYLQLLPRAETQSDSRVNVSQHVRSKSMAMQIV